MTIDEINYLQAFCLGKMMGIKKVKVVKLDAFFISKFSSLRDEMM